jgi:hypothetical protein
VTKSRKSEKPVTIKVGKGSTQQLELKNFASKHTRLSAYTLAALADCKAFFPSYTSVDFERDKKYITTRFECEGISFVTRTLPSFFDGVLAFLETGRLSFPSFKVNGLGYPVFLRKLTKHVFTPVCDADEVQSLKCLYQLCYAFKKLEGPYRESVIRKQLADFVKVDCELKEQFTGVFENKILDTPKNLVTRVMEGLNPFDRSQAAKFKPRPGPGATNTPTEKHVRFRPHVLYTQLAKFPFREWYQPLSMHPQLNRWDLRVGPTYSYSDLPKSGDLTSRFEFVPKTFEKARGICIEELEMQWLQQGVRSALYRTIEEHPLTKGYVLFTDQSVNGHLALQGSATRESATIDMSAASDRISRALVKRLFSGNPELLEALLALSTRTITLPNAPGVPRRLKCKKFAPMGSALCFPVMGLTHWALIKSLFLFLRVPRKDSYVFVYGDDIIVSSKYAHIVYQLLPLFGMKLNKGKSFHRSHFRESCGTHAYKGVDITPTKFKTLVKFPPRNNDLVSNLEYEGALFAKGFKNLASVIRADIQHFAAFRKMNLPCVRKNSGLLGFIREEARPPSAFSKRCRWCSKTNTEQWLVLALDHAVEVPPFLSEVEGYLRWQLSSTDDARYVGGSSTRLQVRRKWVTDSDACGAVLRDKLDDMLGIR